MVGAAAVPAAVAAGPRRCSGRLADDLPGQAARFSTDPLPARTVVAGTPQVRLTVSSVPGAVAGEPVLFAKVYDVAAGDGAPGTRTLLGNAVSPMRLPADADRRRPRCR